MEKAFQEQVEKSIIELKKEILKNDQPDEKTLSMVEDVGHLAYIARTTVSSMLDEINHFSKNAIRNLAFSIYFLIVSGLAFSLTVLSTGIFNLSYFLVFMTCIAAVVVCLYNMFLNVKRAYKIREYFMNLYENPTLDNCSDIRAQLIDMDLL